MHNPHHVDTSLKMAQTSRSQFNKHLGTEMTPFSEEKIAAANKTGYGFMKSEMTNYKNPGAEFMPSVMSKTVQSSTTANAYKAKRSGSQMKGVGKHLKPLLT